MTPEQWLKQNDKILWATKARVRDALERCKKDCGSAITMKRFRELRHEHCEYWFHVPLRQPSKCSALDEFQWLKLSNAIRRRWDQIKGEPIEFAVRLLRSEGVLCNERLLSGSATYSELAREK